MGARQCDCARVFFEFVIGFETMDFKALIEIGSKDWEVSDLVGRACRLRWKRKCLPGGAAVSKERVADKSARKSLSEERAFVSDITAVDTDTTFSHSAGNADALADIELICKHA